MQKLDDLAARGAAKVRQTASRREANLRGTRGRAEQKGGAASSNKAHGGKMAR